MTLCVCICSLQNTDRFTAWTARIKFKKDETSLIDSKQEDKLPEMKRDVMKITTNMEIKNGHIHKRPKHEKPKLILVWKKLHGRFKRFNVEMCPVNNCETTLDHSKINESDVIVFSGLWPVKFPTHRPKGQIWIFQNREAQVCQILII